MTMHEHIVTYREDRYYINRRLGVGLRSERMVPAVYCWFIRLLAGRRYERFKQFHVLYERNPPTDGHD